MDETPEEKWKVVWHDGIPIEDVFSLWDEEAKKKNFRNWFNNKFPKGYADYAAYYVLTHPWEILRYWKRQTKFAWQRVFRGWDDRAVWSLNYHLAEIIPPILKKLKEDKVGIPMFCFEGIEETTFENGSIGYTDENMEIAEKRWNAILDEMITGFERYNTLSDVSSYEEEREEYKKVERALELLKLHFESLWD